MTWLEFAAESKRALKGAGGEKTRARRAVDMFCSWADTQKLPFPSEAPDEEVLPLFRATLDIYEKADGSGLKREGELTMETAERLLNDARMRVSNERAANERVAQQERAALAQQQEAADNEDSQELSPEEDMSNAPDEQDDEQEFEDDGEEQFDEAPPARRPRGRVAQMGGQPVVVVNPNAFRRQPARQPAQAKIPGMQRSTSVEISKVDEMGHTEKIDTYALEEMRGLTIQEFIQKRIAPKFMNEDGSDTTFIATQLGLNGKPTSTSVEVEIEGDGPQQQANDPFRTVDGALNMVERLKSKFGQPEQRPDAMMEAMKQKAVGNNDMQMLMMLMMMERNQRPVDTTPDLTRLVTTILEKQGVIPSAQQQLPPMPMMMPPPQESPAGSKLLDLALSKMAQPPPSIADQMKEVVMMKSMMSELGGGGNDQLAGLKQELAQLRGQLAAASAPKPSGLQESVKEFETVTSLVKSLAPQVTGETGGGGFFGFLKSMLTPAVGAEVARMVTGAQGQPPAGQPQVPQQQVQQQQQVQSPTPVQRIPPPTQAAPATPPAEAPIPQAVRDAQNAIMLAQTPPAIAERFGALIMAMYQSGDERFLVHLQPAMSELMKPVIGVDELKPARKVVFGLVANTRPELATPEFADSVLASLGAMVGLEMPPVLAETAGQWTVLFNGDVKMLSEFGAKKVEVSEPAPVAETAPEPAPTPTLRPAASPEQAAAFLEKQRRETAEARALEEQSAPTSIEPVMSPEAVRA